MTYREGFANHRYLISVCFAYMVIVTAVCLYVGVDLKRFALLVGFFAMLPVFYLPVLMTVCFGAAVRACLTDKMSAIDLFPDIMRRTEKGWEEFVQSAQAKNGFAGLLAISPLLIFFCIIKSLFPVLAPHQMDATFAAWDHAIHFGMYPHEYLVGFLRRIHFGPILESIYLVWFLFMFGTNFYAFFFDRDMHRRKQYLWTFALCWIVLGTIMALSLYSVGPIFLHFQNVDPFPYRDIIDWLSGDDPMRPTQSFMAATMLYKDVTDNIHPDANGMSAMPSMHVSIAWLIALYMFRFSKTKGVLMALYALSIVVASVALGWHYALDGYVSIAATTILWVVSGAALKRKI